MFQLHAGHETHIRPVVVDPRRRNPQIPSIPVDHPPRTCDPGDQRQDGLHQSDTRDPIDVRPVQDRPINNARLVGQQLHSQLSPE